MSSDFGPSVGNYEIFVLFGRNLDFPPSIAFVTFFGVARILPTSHTLLLCYSLRFLLRLAHFLPFHS